MIGDGYVLMVPETRAAVARTREPVLDDDGFVTHHEMRESLCLVHTLQVGRGGWVCEFEGGSVKTVPYENVRFIDDEDE